MWLDPDVVWEFEFDRSAGEHDEREGGFGGVESVGAVEHGADLVVQSLVAAVAHATVNGGSDAVLVFADGAGGLDEFRDPGPLCPGAPPVEQLEQLLGGQVAGEHRPQGFLELVAAG